MPLRSVTHKLVLGFLAVTLVLSVVGGVFAYSIYLGQAERQKTADLSLYVQERSPGGSLDQMVSQVPPGTGSLIVTEQGEVVRRAGGASVLAGSPELAALVARIEAQHAPRGVVKTPDGRSLVAYGFLPQPHLILLASFPMAGVERAAIGAMVPMITFRLGALAIQILLLIWIARRVVLSPLVMLSRHKRESAMSDELSAIEARQDEIGALARSLSEERALNREILSGLEERVRERTAELERANLAKSDFLANMSHELRTPLNGVIALSKLLLQEQTSDRGRQTAELVVASGRLLEQVLSDILDVSKIEAGQLRLDDAAFDLGTCVDNIAALHSASAAAKGLRFRHDIDADLRGWRRGDDVRVTQILSNLLSNAVKFTEAGEVRLRVVPSGERIAFIVEDTGVGFSEAFRDRLFGRFEQADATTARRFGGTGLGLAICASLTELMGGEIEASSEPGRGSAFTVTLPLPPAEPTVTSVGGDSTGAKGGELTRLAVLVAEDHPTNRKVVELILEPLGVELTMVDNGRKAVEALQQRQFDLVLMDVQMPVVDGLAATREIRALEAELGLPRSRIIALTANALPEHIEQTREAGMDGHLCKPIQPADLIEVLRSVDLDAQAA